MSNKTQRKGFCPGDLTPLKKDAAMKRLFVGRSITKSTNQKHRALLELFFGFTVVEIIHYFDTKLRFKQWVCTTARTKLGNLMGLNARIRHSLFEEGDPVFKDYVRYVDNLCLAHDVKFPYPMDKDSALAIAEHLKESREDDLLTLFALQWSTTGRTSDVLLLQKRRVHVDRKTTNVTLTFIEGKGVKARKSPYTVSTSTPFVMAVQRHLDATASTYVFPPATRQSLQNRLRTTLKKFDHRFELRSMRRGSLQHMASQGIDLDVLQTFSGHRSRNTLLRYLDWGKFAKVMLDDQTAAAELLW